MNEKRRTKESKGLKALDRLEQTARWCCGELAVTVEVLNRGIFKEDAEAVEIIRRELKALEIIKKKGINIQELRYSYSLNEYNICKGTGNESLKQEEYDLLKGVFK
jgi:hypothetical protein